MGIYVIITLETSLGVWSFVRGQTTLNSPGNYTQIGYRDPYVYPRAKGYNSLWKDSLNNIWMYGGRTYSDDTNGKGVIRVVQDVAI